MTPEDALDDSDRHDMLSRCDLAVIEGHLELTPKVDGFVALVGSSRLPVRINHTGRNSVQRIVMPRSGLQCEVVAHDHVDLNEVDGGNLLLRMSRPRHVTIGGAGPAELAVTTEQVDDPSPTQAGRLVLPRAIPLTFTGGSWSVKASDGGRFPEISLIDAALHGETLVEAEMVSLAGRCEIGPLTLRAETIRCGKESSVLLSSGSSHTFATRLQGRMEVSSGSTGQLHVAEGDAEVHCADGAGLGIHLSRMGRAEIAAPTSNVYVASATSIAVSAALLHVHGSIVNLSGSVGSFEVRPGCTVYMDEGFKVERVNSVADAELLHMNPYTLRLSDIQSLDSARLVSFRFRPNKMHEEQLDAVAALVGGNEAASVLWYRIGSLLERHGGTGAGRAVARRTEHEYRRRSLAPGRTSRVSSEWAWLTAYKIIGYGDRVLRPLGVHLVVAAVLAVGLAGAERWPAPGRWWAITWRLLLQPLRFFLRDEDALRLTTDAAKPGLLLNSGWPSDFAPILVQIIGTLLVAASINAVRRLVKAR
jgi:hypothetical protein